MPVPRNGSGTYSPPAGTAAVPGQVIASTPYNNLVADIGNELTGSVPTNGSKGMAAALSMNSNRITLVSDPTGPQDAATKNYVDTVAGGGGTVFVGGTTTGTAAAQVLASTVPTAFNMNAGNRLIFIPGFTATGATTLTITSPATGPVNLLKYSPSGPIALSGGEIVAAQPVEFISNGTSLLLVTNSERLGKPASISANTTYTASDIGRFIEMTGGSTFTTTLPAPPATGGSFRFYNASSVSQTLSTPSGTFAGPGGSASSTVSLLTGETAVIYSDGTNWIVIVRYISSSGIWAPGTLYGLTLSRTGTTTYGIATGSTVNEDGSAGRNMTLGSAFTKSLSAWAVGSANGSLDTGSVGANTWYHVHLIRKDSDSSIDVLMSLSPTSPTMPGGYTARRRIGSFRTDGSSQIVAFTQVGDYFLWALATIDVDATNPGTAAVTRTVNVPTGVVVDADFLGGTYNGTTNSIGFIFSPLSMTDQAPQAPGTAALSGFGGGIFMGTTNAWGTAEFRVQTNTSAQIRSRMSASGAADHMGIITKGWFDTRGRT